MSGKPTRRDERRAAIAAIGLLIPAMAGILATMAGLTTGSNAVLTAGMAVCGAAWVLMVLLLGANIILTRKARRE